LAARPKRGLHVLLEGDMANTNDTRTTPQKLADIAERTVVTAAEAIGAVLLTKGTISFSATEVAILGAVAGGLAAVRTLVANWLSGQQGPQEWLEDMFSRATFTFAQTLVAALTVSAGADGLHLPGIRAAAMAGAAAALTAVKAALARGVMSNPVFSPASLLRPSASGTTGQQGNLSTVDSTSWTAERSVTLPSECTATFTFQLPELAGQGADGSAEPAMQSVGAN
jgi:hypothetical protein